MIRFLGGGCTVIDNKVACDAGIYLCICVTSGYEGVNSVSWLLLAKNFLYNT